MEDKHKEYIGKLATDCILNIDRSRDPNVETQKTLVRELEKNFLNEIPPCENTLALLSLNGNWYISRFFEDVLFKKNYSDELLNPFNFDHPVIKSIIHPKNLQANSTVAHVVYRYISDRLIVPAGTDNNTFIKYLYNQGFSDEDIISIVCTYSYNIFNQHYSKDKSVRLTSFAEYVLPLLKPKKGFLGLKTDNGYLSLIYKCIFEKNSSDNKKLDLLTFLYENYPEGLENYYKNFLVYKDYNGQNKIDYNCLFYLIQADAQKFEPLILDVLMGAKMEMNNEFSVFMSLSEKLSGKYNNKITEIGENYYTTYFKIAPSVRRYYYDLSTQQGSFSIAYAEFLFKTDEEKAKQRMEKFIKESDFVFPELFSFLDNKMGDKCIPYLLDALFKDQSVTNTGIRNYYTKLFEILGKYNLVPHFNRIIDFAINHASSKSRILAAQNLAKYPNEIVPIATNLLAEKTVNQRIVGALILSEVGSEEVITTLNEAVDSETNDDTRDIMLDSLRDIRFAKPYSLTQVKDMIKKAADRKKLSKWGEKWLVEEKLPGIFWKGDKKPMDLSCVRFLFYRMKRAPGLNSDIEAKQMIQHIDKELSQDFAKAVLVAFQESNADTKIKYYLTLAGLLGGDDMMHNLNALFRKNMADKRMKMAEYVVGALAMVGTDKALRSVEVISRKYANKKPAISLAAREALTAAANELEITMDELSDRIIPDFGFDGLYKTFQVDGEEYRAFINSDFTLNYFNEDNKMRKSLPGNAPKELKAEFKDIEKEIKDVIKSQSDRLERYMYDERRWNAESWQTFFFNNPIMFVYALKLLWGLFDKNGNLLNSFYCSDDASVYDVDDNEVAIEDDMFVGILHPVYLSSEVLKKWQDKLYEKSMLTIFPILSRSIFIIDEKEKEQNYTKAFFNQNVPKGADFVNTFMVKKNWIKSSGDGGSSEFTKHFKGGEIKAYANIEGPAAFYMGGNTPATVFEISFFRKGWQDKVCLKDLPAIFYSEVMSDIDQLIKAT